MISGANLLDYAEKYSTRIFLEKRCKRVVLPFVIWSIVAVIIRACWGEIQFDTGIKSVIKQLIDLSINNGCMFGGVFWFFYMIIILYLTIPFFAEIPKANRKLVYGSMIIMAFMYLFLEKVMKKRLGDVKWGMKD